VSEARPVTWREAMHNALYGDAGFYLDPGAPARHFRTAAHATQLWAGAIHTLAERVDQALESPASFTVVDAGAGGGELLAMLADIAPSRWSLIGVDLAPRPRALPDRVAWCDRPPDQFAGLLIATELLDVVPLDVAIRTEDGPRLLTVSPSGAEAVGGQLSARDAAWLDAWWPMAEVGDRGETGWTRDELWRSLTESLTRGVAIAIDYAADPRRDVGGTLMGYRDGRASQPIPDGRTDLTAHVLFESLRCPDDLLLSQRDALRSLGVRADVPTYDGEPRLYLAEVSAAGAAAELLDPNDLGAFTWLVHTIDIAAPFSM
jgi:SAM-dependent MidA family methyltransferase